MSNDESKAEMESIVSNASPPICMCQNALTEYNRISKGMQCSNCFKSISPKKDKSIYQCESTTCIYGRIMSQMYYICAQCYNTGDTIDIDNNAIDKIGFVCKKTLSSINTISYVQII